MAKFGIEYSQAVPTGQSGSVRANLNVDQGEGEIGRAVYNLGKDAHSKYLEIRNAEERLQVSAGERQIREKIFAAQNSLTGDEKADAEVWEQANTDINAVQFDSSRVNDELTLFKDTNMPSANQDYLKMHMAKRAKNIHDSYKAEGQGALRDGDLVRYQQILDQQLDAQDLTPAMHKSLSESAFGDSLLEQARDLINSDSAQENTRGLGILDNISKLENVTLSTEQKVYKNKLQKLAVKTTTEKSDATKQSLVIKMDNNRDKTAVERQEMAAEMKQEAIEGGITGEDTAQYFDMVNEWSEQDKDPTEQFSPQVRAAVGASIELNPNSISAPQIFGLVGLGPDAGLTATQAIAMNERRLELIDKRPSMQKEMSGRKQEQLKYMFNSGAMGMNEYNLYADKLTEYSNLNKDFTRDEMNDFFNTMTTGTVSTWWKKAALEVASVLPGVAVGRMLQQKSKLKKMKRDKAASTAPPKDTRTVGMTAQAPDGSTWILKTKHDIPALDVWEEVE